MSVNAGDQIYANTNSVDQSVSDISSSTLALSESGRPRGYQPSPSFRQSINASTDGVRGLMASLQKSAQRRKNKISSIMRPPQTCQQISIDDCAIKQKIKISDTNRVV